MPTPRRSARQLAELLADPGRALIDPRYRSEPVCARWIQHVAEVSLFDPEKALPLALLGVRLAQRTVRAQRRRRLAKRCVLAQAWGVLGSVYRATGRLERSARALTKASQLAAACLDPDVRSDVHRRRAFLALYQAQNADGSLDPPALATASQHAEDALREARGTYAEARARIARAIVAMRHDDTPAAAAQARHALELLDPTKHPFDHASALSVLISALTRGGADEREEAMRFLGELRAALPKRSPALRARLLWAEALLLLPNRQRKARARRLLDQARRRFVRLGMAAEAVAVTAELARIAPAGPVPRLCAELLPLLVGGPLRQLVEKLAGARLVDRVDLAEGLRARIHAPGVLPAPG